MMNKLNKLSAAKILSIPFSILFYGIAGLLLIHLSACTPTQLRTADAPMYFAGRLSLVQDPAPDDLHQQPQSWSAHFELAGTPEKGNLLLYTPVGTTVAKVTWRTQQAIVQTADDLQYFANLDELTSTYFKQNIPVAALFDWLRGKPPQQEVTGWHIDLSASERGIIKAERTTPLPRVQLRLVVDEHIDNMTITQP